MLHLSKRLFNTPLLCLALLASTATAATANPGETTNLEEDPILKIEIDQKFYQDRQLLDPPLWWQHQQQLDFQRQLWRQNQQLQRDLRQQQFQQDHQQIRNQQQQQMREYQQWLRDQQRQQLQQQNIYVPLQQPQLRGF